MNNAGTRRIIALIRKETLQVVRDPSSILIGLVLPIVLLFLFAYAVSLDLDNIPIGLVIPPNAPGATRVAAAFGASPYYRVITAPSSTVLEPLLVGGELTAIVVLPPDFQARLERGEQAPIQALIRGTDIAVADIVRGYIERTLASWSGAEAERRGRTSAGGPALEPRAWCNPQLESRATLLPGSIAVILTLIGTMLTSLIVVREWERGTMEALLTTHLSRFELLTGKFIPYFGLGMTAAGLVTLVATLGLGIPLRGSVGVLMLVTAIYMAFALGLGMFISTLVNNQFMATQIALVVGFLPSFLLSGLVFEIQSMPSPLRWLTYLFPPRYFVTALRTIYLAGNVPRVIIPRALVMAGFAIVFLGLTLTQTRVRLK